MKKSILSLFLVILMTVCFVPVSALADSNETTRSTIDSGSCGENVTWELDSDGHLMIRGSGAISSSPWTDYDYYRLRVKRVTVEGTITSICDDGFNGCLNLERFSYDLSGEECQMTKIGKRAFANCISMETSTVRAIISKMEAPNLQEIGEGAFQYCDRVRTVEVPDNVKTIGADAFSNCKNLEEVDFGSGIETLPDNMFNDCPELNKVVLPSGLTSIGCRPFANCPKLAEITMDYGNYSFFTEDNVLYDSYLKETLYVCAPAKGNFTMPETVEVISDYAFYGCANMERITISEDLESIGKAAFYGCTNLESIIIPEYVRSIGDYAFYGCDSLRGIALPGLSEIADFTFAECKSLTSITILHEVEKVGESAFSNCSKLAKITFLGNAPTFHQNAFANLNTEVHFPARNAHWTDEVLQDYGGEINWTADNPIDLSACVIDSISDETYTGNAIEPELTVTLNNKTLVKDRDYTISFENNTNVGTATLTISGKLRYTGSADTSFKINPAMVEVPSGKTLTYTGKEQTGVDENELYSASGSSGTEAGEYTATLTLIDKNNTTWSDGTVADKNVKWEINKASNPMTAKGKTAQVKYKKLKKSSQTLAVTKVIKFTKDAKDNKTYKLSSAKKGSKSFKKYFKVKKSTGKVTVKKGLKKGTYKVIVKIKAQGNTNYEASAWKKVTFKVTVK